MNASPLAATLTRALAALRAQLADPVAPIAVVVPGSANGVLARHQLALAGPFIRVEMRTPEQLVRALGARSLTIAGLRPEPPGWREATIGAAVRELASRGALGRFGDRLTHPGWSAALASALDTLETAGLGPADLRATHLPDHRERLELLATLMCALDERRQADRLYTPAQLCAAALAATCPPRFAGAVVLGDRLLPPGVFEVLTSWLRQRPHVEVQPAAWQHLQVAPSSLRAAIAPDALRLPVPADPTTALGHLAQQLFAPSSAHRGPTDDSVVWARTPDDVRELAEATREVVRAVEGGVPLDQIAIVLPDAEQVDVLRGHLQRAGIPATWLVGAPLTGTPAARFLMQLLTLAGGDERVPTWYALLRQPGLRLRHAVPGQVSKGRWRRILRTCGAVRTTSTVLAAVTAWRDEIDPDGPDPVGNHRAADQLLAAVRALGEVASSLQTPATLGEHAQRWASLLHTWWVPSADRDQLATLLGRWGPPTTGAPVPLAVATSQLRDALAQQPDLQGSLTDPAVRVVTPMTLLGGAVRRVIVTGLTEGRFPRRPSEDPLLPDDVLEALSAARSVRLPTSRDLGAFEDRRFAAVVGACTERLWLSAPATDLLKARPLLPSSLLLDAASAHLGHRARYADLQGLMHQVGSRARPWAASTEQAIGPMGYRISHAATDPASGLRALLGHDVARRLMAFHHGLSGRVRSAYTGLVPVELFDLPALTGEPLSAWDLASLLGNPSRFFVEHVLGVRSMAQLEGHSGDLDAKWRDKRLRRAANAVLADPAGSRDAILAAYDEHTADWARWRDDVPPQALAVARDQLVHALDRLLPALTSGTRAPCQGAVAPDLPWVVTAELGWVDAGRLAHLHWKKPARKQAVRDAPEVVLAALAHGGLHELYVCGPDGKGERFDLQQVGDEARGLLRIVTSAARDGWFPVTKRRTVHLAADPTFELQEPTP